MASASRTRLKELKAILDKAVSEDSSLLKALFAVTVAIEDEVSDDTYNLVVIKAVEELLTHGLGLNQKTSHVSYAPLAGTLKKYNISTTEMCKAIGVGTNIRKAILNDRPVSTLIINKISMLLNCEIDDIIEYVPESELLRRKQFGNMVKSVPELFEATITSRYNPAYGKDLDGEEEISIEQTVRSMTLTFQGLEHGYSQLFEYLDIEESDYEAWSGVANSDDNDYDN